MRLSKRWWVKYPAVAYIEMIRGMPLLLLIFWFYYLAPVVTGQTMPAFTTTMFCFMIFTGAYVGEIVRAGVIALPKGQMEASRSSGLSHVQAMRFVILPQALRNMIPSFVNQFVSLTKDTSLAAILGVIELTRTGVQVDNRETVALLRDMDHHRGPVLPDLLRPDVLQPPVGGAALALSGQGPLDGRFCHAGGRRRPHRPYAAQTRCHGPGAGRTLLPGRALRFLRGCASIPSMIEAVGCRLNGEKPVPVCVVGFPLGATLPEVKAFETSAAVARGAREIDMVLNLGAFKGGEDDLARRDVQAVVDAAGGFPVKVILETALLSDEEIVRACRISVDAGAAFVKTSTGFGPGGATAHAVSLMRRTVGSDIGVKASGGIHTFADAVAMIEAGADRIGASASVAIVSE